MTVKAHDAATSVLVDSADASNIFVGIAQSGTATSDAFWQIKKIVISGTDVAIKYPNGATTYTFVWNNRGTYTYS